MALLFMESFDWISTSASSAVVEDLMLKKYDLADVDGGGGETVLGRRGGSALDMGSLGGNHFQTPTLRDGLVDETIICGFMLKTPEIISTAPTFFFHVMAGSIIQTSVRLFGTGAFGVYDGAIFLRETSPPLVQPGRWYYVEIKIKVSTTVGSIEVRFDGNVVWTSATNLDLRSDTTVFWDAVRFRAGMGNKQILDDIYICDSSGAVNNDYLGDTSVEHINPNAVGDNSAWTPSSAVDHYTLVDDGTNRTALVDETDYVSSSTTAQKDLFNYEALASPGVGDASLIHGVQVNTWARITEIQPSDLISKTKTGTTEAGVTTTIRRDDTNQFIETAIFEQDADTAAAWTVSGVDGAQFGIETGTV